jgi:rod shape-determining protein MreD
MIQTLPHRIGLILLIIFLQIFVFNKICLGGYAVPLMGVMILFHIPVNAGRISAMLLAFMVGLLLDAFSNTPGISAGAMVATSFVQQPLLHGMAPKDSLEDSVPNKELLGKYKYFFYMAILMAVHHGIYFLLDAFTFFNPITLLLRFVSSYALSMLFAYLLEMFRKPKA